VRLLIACDFDGTITERDTLHLIVERFGTPGSWDAIEPRLRAGEITLERAMEEQFAGVRARPDEVMRLIDASAAIRPGFHELVEWSRAEDHDLVVLSSGFAEVIRHVLEREGLADLPMESHDAEFTAQGTRIIWSERGEAACELCGRRCKRHDLAHHRDAGQTVAYIGDGVSDRCAAQAADIVYARAQLAEYLDSIGVAHRRYDDFHEIRADLTAVLA
jgi:2-hydroxy-3-keto-5-methylthiopentenyl-1-phosphate phosphatase